MQSLAILFKLQHRFTRDMRFILIAWFLSGRQWNYQLDSQHFPNCKLHFHQNQPYRLDNDELKKKKIKPTQDNLLKQDWCRHNLQLPNFWCRVLKRIQHTWILQIQMAKGNTSGKTCLIEGKLLTENKNGTQQGLAQQQHINWNWFVDCFIQECWYIQVKSVVMFVLV